MPATLNSPLTAHFHWVADPGTNSPPPAQVSVTQTCALNWAMSDYDRGVSGRYNTIFGQTGPIAANTNSSGGGSKTFSVSTGGNSSFNVTFNPVGSFAGYLKYGCSYETLGFHLMATATFSTTSLVTPSPNGHPNLGDGSNQYVYTSSTPIGYLYVPGTLQDVTIVANSSWLSQNNPNLLIENPAIPNVLAYQWTVSSSAGTASVNTPNSGYPGYQSGALVYQGLPSTNSGFGNHDANLYVSLYLQNTKADSAKVQTFFPTKASNWPGSDGTPNWFHYYNQVSPASGKYTATGISGTSANTDASGKRTSVITLADSANTTSAFRVFGLNGAVSPYVVYLGVFVVDGVHRFVYSSAHEQGHKNAWLTPGIEGTESDLDKDKNRNLQLLCCQGGRVFTTLRFLIRTERVRTQRGPTQIIQAKASHPILATLNAWQIYKPYNRV